MGTSYDITGEWSAHIEAVIKKDSNTSRFSDDEFGDLSSP
jgi:hypothetical protein